MEIREAVEQTHERLGLKDPQYGPGSCEPQAGRPVIETLEIIEAFQQENAALWREVHSLREKVGKFERIFERIFQEEAAERLTGPKPSYGEALQASPLERLKFKGGLR